MSKVLNLFRRRGVAEGEARGALATRPTPTPLPAAPPPINPRINISDDGSSSAAATAAASTTTLTGTAATESITPSATDLVVLPRRQSQINLNKFLASAPVGLNAVLKQPSRGDALDMARSQGSGSLGTAMSVPSPQQLLIQQQLQQQLQQQNNGVGGVNGTDAPPMKPIRERRRSMTATELAQSMQNIDASQAALIMMPARLKQELGVQQSFSQQLTSSTSGTLPVRPSLQLPAALSADSYSLSSVPASGAAANGGGLQPRLDRKPSLIREAVKLQQQPNQQSRTSGVTSESPARNPIGVPSGESPTPPAGGASGGLITRRSVAAPGLSPLQLQQLQQLQTANGSGRASVPLGSVSPTSHGHALRRRSDMGEGILGRGRGLEPQQGQAGGLPLSPTLNGNANNYMRRSGISNRGSEALPAGDDDGGPLVGPLASSQYDIRLPVIGGAGTLARRSGVANGGKEKEMVVSINSGGGRGGLTASDVAALSEAISSYESEAARLRAMAIRKVDSRIKRAVMDRRMTSDEDPLAGPGNGSSGPSSLSLPEGGLSGNLLAPLVRQQQGQTEAGSNSSASRTSNQAPAPRNGPRGATASVGSAAAATVGATSGAGGLTGSSATAPLDSLAKARTRLMETEAETDEELSQMRRNSNLAPRLLAAELYSDPSVPRRPR
ncbi:hypothetical protein Vafri_9652 [Volvox africanus]|uniref:Uncharacterized protein n=1 Tax=Volvox africanus TaxID=51714 RepID=A0A8J4B5K9_9CHLO|nr:hypothetical protein Vafri_9652 [Volvox africanus]